MRRAFFIVAVCLATSSFASIPRVSAPDVSSPSFDALSETRIRVSEDLAPFERPAPSLLSRALRQSYEQASTTSASGLAGFLSVDPVLETEKAMREPQRWNRYSYVANNPLRYTDPTGKTIWSILGRGAIEVLGYAGRKSETLVARIVPKNKKEGLDAIRGAIRQARADGATSVAVVAPTNKRAEAISKALSENGATRPLERSGNWPAHYNPATGEFADVHVQTAAATKSAGLGSSLLSIIGATTLAATSNPDATPGEILSAVAWDTAKAIDPLFVTDAIEHATGINEYTSPPER